MKQRIFNLVILDESGSMGSICKEAIDSVNETFQTIKAAGKKHPEQEHYVTFVTFNDFTKVVYDCVEVEEAVEISEDVYQPNCCTALYDAMGISLTALKKKVAAEDRVLVTVVTDGYENASHEYSREAIKKLVEQLKERGWVFAYIGANHDVTSSASAISITNTMTFEATAPGMFALKGIMNRSREAIYDCMAAPDFNPAEANENFFKDNEG